MLVIQDLTFSYDAEGLAMCMLADVFHAHILQVLKDVAYAALAQHLELLGERLGTVLKKSMPAGKEIDMSALRLRSVQIVIEQEGIRLDGTATGGVRMVLL